MNLQDLNLTLELITPTLAKDMLKKNTNNRPVNNRQVELYSADMENNEWQVEACQPIILDDNQRILDGQHRLHAIVRSNTTHFMLIKRGTPVDVRAVLDTGLGRTASHEATMQGIPNSSKMTRTAQFLLRHDTYGLRNAASSSPKIINRDVVDFVKEHQNSLEYALGRIGNIKIGPVGSALIVPTFYLSYKEDEDKAEHFMEEFLNEEESSIHQIITLKNLLNRHLDKGSSSSTTRSILITYLSHAWYAYKSDLVMIKNHKSSIYEQVPDKFGMGW